MNRLDYIKLLILTIVRWAIVLPILLLENILKGITLILLVVMMIVCAIIYPLIRNVERGKFIEAFYFYATTWRGKGYALSRKVFKLWQQ